MTIRAAIQEILVGMDAEFLPYRFVLDHGVEVGCRAEALGQRRVKGCHGNAAHLAGRWPNRYRWWTGYALHAEFGLVFEHSWVERAGEHLEITMDAPAAGYIGVPVEGLDWASSHGHPIENIAWSYGRGRGREVSRLGGETR